MKKLSRISCFLIFLLFAMAFEFSESSVAENNLITVYCDRELGPVNRKIFGNNFLGHDPSQTSKEKWAQDLKEYSDYGSGIWDPRRNSSVKEVIDLAKEAGTTVIRFPGGCGSHLYNWRDAVGENRKKFLYGINEFLQTCDEINARAIFTVSYFLGDHSDAADLIKYLALLNDKNSERGAVKVRANKAHLSAYDVRYFEIGNEIWHGNHNDIQEVSPADYAHRYLKYYDAMKAVNPSIEIGAVMYTPEWNRTVLNIIKAKIDFAIVHTYPPAPELGAWDLIMKSPEDIFKIALGIPVVKDEVFFSDTLRLLKENSGRDIPLAITEYNGGFVQEKPIPYRHCLGTALINAELLRIFMKPEHNIVMANYWNFVNEYWGMIANGFNGDYKTLYNPYFRRPSFFVFSMYNMHFGNILIKSEAECNSYNMKISRSFIKSLSKRNKSSKKEEIKKTVSDLDSRSIPYLSVNASKSTDGNKIYLMVINKNMRNPMVATIDLKGFVPDAEVNAWVLNGPSVDATNEKKYDNVKVTHNKFEIRNNLLEFTFEPHSLTAVELIKKKNEK